MDLMDAMDVAFDRVRHCCSARGRTSNRSETCLAPFGLRRDFFAVRDLAFSPAGSTFYAGTVFGLWKGEKNRGVSCLDFHASPTSTGRTLRMNT